jgi:hypothetical protein
MAIPQRATRVEPPAKGPDFVKTPDAQPLREHVVPRMGQSYVANKPDVWRMADAEIDEVMVWLYPKLMERWPRLDADRLVYFLKNAMPSRTMLLCRTTNVVGCFEIGQDIFEPLPFLKERFVRQREPMIEEAAKLYVYAMKWAQQVKGRVCWFGMDSNIGIEDMGQIARKVLGAKQRSYFWLDLMEKRPA